MEGKFLKPILFIFIFLVVLSVSLASGFSSKDLHGWALIVDITRYKDPEINITDFNDSLTDKLKARFVNNGSFSEEHIFILKSQECTFNNLKQTFEKLSQKLKKNERFVLYFRGCVTKPSTVKPAYLMVYDTSSDNLDKAISEKSLGEWLKKIKAEEKILIMNYFPFRSDARRYTINRPIIGTSSINVFQPLSTQNDLFAKKITESLKSNETDNDDSRSLSVREIYEYVTIESGLYLSPMGNLDNTLIQLPSMLQIKTEPSGAVAYVNGDKLGITPQRIVENLRLQSYEIEVHKNGYIQPEERIAKIRKPIGESANIVFELIPIKIYGKVKMASEEELPDKLEVAINDWVISVDNGNYCFHDWDKHNLEVGKKYTIVAKSSDLYYGSAEFVLDGEKDINRDIELKHRDWFQIAQERFEREDYEKAVLAFQIGAKDDPNFSGISQDFADTLYYYFEELITMVPDNLNYIIATAKLAKQLGLKKEAEKYWKVVENKSPRGSASHKLAIAHLKELAPYRNLIRWILLVVLLLTLISSGYIVYKYRKRKSEAKT